MMAMWGGAVLSTTKYATLNDAYVSDIVMGELDKYSLIGFSMEADHKQALKMTKTRAVLVKCEQHEA